MKGYLHASKQCAVRLWAFIEGRSSIILRLPLFISATYSTYVNASFAEILWPTPHPQGNLYLPKDKADLKVELERLVGGAFLTTLAP